MNKFILYRYLDSKNSKTYSLDGGYRNLNILDEDYINFDIVDPSLFPITNASDDAEGKERIEKFISKLDQEKVHVRNLDRLIPDSGCVCPVFLNVDTQNRELKEIRICSTANFTSIPENDSQMQHDDKVYKSEYDGRDQFIDETNYKKRRFSIDNTKPEFIKSFESKSGNITLEQLDFSYSCLF